MDSPRHFVTPSALLHCNCPPQAIESSSRIVTGRRCWLTSCIDFGNGHRHYHSRLCQLTTPQQILVPLLNPSAIASTKLLASHSDMVRHRMRSRRGGTQGGGARPHTEQNLEPAASSTSPEMYHPHSYGSGRYPNTRSGRGRAMSPGEGRREFAVHTANFPLPPHPAPHSTQFKFCSTLNRPVITATITILFTKDNDQPDTQAENSDLQQEEALRHRNGRDTGKNLQNEGKIALHGQTKGGSQHAKDGSSSATHSPGGIGIEGPDSKAAVGCHGDVQLAGGPHGEASAEEEDDWMKYAYPVVEEPVPDELE